MDPNWHMLVYHRVLRFCTEIRVIYAPNGARKTDTDMWVYSVYVVRKPWIWDNLLIAQHKQWIYTLRRQSMDCPRPNMID